MRADEPRRLLEAEGRHLVAPRRDAADAVARAAVDDLRQLPLLLHRRRVERQQGRIGTLHFRSSGAISFGRIRGISGQMMIAASMSSIGISMISVSFSANFSGTLATAHEIRRHRP